MDRQHTHLAELLESAAARVPERVAVQDESNRRLTYADLARAADRIATRLIRWGAGRGDRVGLMLPKSLESVSAIHGILRAGAAYVPVDPTAPPRRSVQILADARVRAIVVSAELSAAVNELWPLDRPRPRLMIACEDARKGPLDASWNDVLGDAAPSPLRPEYHPDDLAYILYTSGSTGVPKGVMLSHASAFCFLNWCVESLDLRDGDRFSAHAPFHFDLSVFDLYVSCLHGGSLCLISETLARDPHRLAQYLQQERIDVWYSAPSILALMSEHEDLGAPGLHAPRLVLFAGEVFPIRPLKRLRAQWPNAHFWNLYGPTETNVCTAYRVPDRIDEARTEPFPIGSVCQPLRARVVDESGKDVEWGAQGELLIAGPGVMRGYFGRPDLTSQAFIQDDAGISWYRTGDVVVADERGCFTFHGRRDRMVKKRGYRIELGEIESALYRHDDVSRAAVLARSEETGVCIDAFVSVKPERKTSIIAMKKHCTMYLPHYMVPDRIRFVSEIPTTSTDKVDYQALKNLDAAAGAA